MAAKGWDENSLGLLEEPEYTCPMLDEALEKASDAETHANYAASENSALEANSSSDPDDCEELYQALTRAVAAAGNAEDSASGVADGIEQARTNAEELRDWGQEWKNIATRLLEGIYGGTVPAGFDIDEPLEGVTIVWEEGKESQLPGKGKLDGLI